MARGINRVTLVGYVGADPELMHSEQGTPICNISLATTEGWRDMNGQVQTRTEWHRVVFFKRTAEVAAEFLRKGSLVYVEGRLSTNRWEDQQGIVRYTTEIIGTELGREGRAVMTMHHRTATAATAAITAAAMGMIWPTSAALTAATAQFAGAIIRPPGIRT